MPSQVENSAKQAQIEVGQLPPYAATPGTRSQAQKDRGQKITPTDPTRPPSSTRAVTQRVRPVNCTGLVLPRVGRAVHALERTRARRRAAARHGRPVAATAKVAVSPILLGNRVFRSRGSPCVCPVGSFRRRALPYTPRSVRGPRGVARRGTGGRPEQPPKRGFSRPTRRAAE